MIEISDNTTASEAVNKRARRCFVRKESLDTYIVKPRLHGKTRRRVRFELRGNRLLAECRNYYKPYEECPASTFGVGCYHVWSALRRMRINLQKEERRGLAA